MEFGFKGPTDFRYACCALSGNWVPPMQIQKDNKTWDQEACRRTSLCSSWCLLLNKGGKGMAQIPEPWREAGVWRTSMPSSPLSESSVCYSLSPSVTPQSAVATRMHLSILAMMACRSITHSVIASKGKHVIPLCSDKATKVPFPSKELFSSSSDRSAESAPSVIHLSICLPVLAPCRLTLVTTTWLYALWEYLNGFWE